MECAKVPAGVRKAKKKQVKDELDRIKQAEKKKRRLEKALATSAAIRSELEKKKQQKKEEQQRLDEEGAAIAEAVALHVLLGEDSDDSCKVMLKKDEELTSLDNGGNFDFVMGGRQAIVPHHDLSNYLLEGSGLASEPHEYGCMWNCWGNSNLIVPSGSFVRDFHPQYFEEDRWDAADLSAGLLAAQAVSSLQITDDARVDAYIFNQMLRGTDTVQHHLNQATNKHNQKKNLILNHEMVTEDSDIISQGEVESTLQSSQPQPKIQTFPSIGRQSSIYPLTLDEFQHGRERSPPSRVETRGDFSSLVLPASPLPSLRILGVGVGWDGGGNFFF
ncbi:hypothetical protein Adt_12398 [Abeliophyllum distichum]|uniref:Uncharacterized protein n=1 Tax=Abeliophyllum distichum TaxID=126358 RepID=A0ABD1UQP2_9LAMI